MHIWLTILWNKSNLFGLMVKKPICHGAKLALLLSLFIVNSSLVFAQDTSNDASTNSLKSNSSDNSSSGSIQRTTDCNTSGDVCPANVTTPDSSNSSFRPSTNVGNPISLVTGNKYEVDRDYSIAGSALEFSRHYNSSVSLSNSGVGQGWRSSYSSRLTIVGDSGFNIHESTGRVLRFVNSSIDDQGVTRYTTSSPANGSLYQADDNTTFWELPDGRTIRFKGSYLTRIDYPGHQKLTLLYKRGRVAEVSDEADRRLLFEYTPSQGSLPDYSDGIYKEWAGHLTSLTLPDGKKIFYDYDRAANLARVRYADGTNKQYHYENEDYPNHLTGISDRLGNRFATWEYNDAGLAISSEHAGGVERVTLDYGLSKGDDTGTTYVTNSLGVVSTYQWQRLHSGETLLLSAEGPGCSTCPQGGMSYSYTQNGQLASSTDLSGKKRHYHYDNLNRIERVERTSATSTAPLLEVRYEYDDQGTKPARTFKPSVNGTGEYQLAIRYNSENLPEQITESGFAPLVPSAISQLANRYKPVSRTTRLSYEAGRVSEVDGPRDDVDDITRFSYDQHGRMERMELPSGEALTINQYDENGRALEFRRAAHPPVTLQYDNYGNVSRITQLGQSVNYLYNAENRLTSVTNPNGKTSTLSYDEAQRLKSVSDDLGRTIALTFNTENQEQNRTFLGVNGALINSLNYVFDAEGRIQSVTEEQSDHSSGNTVASTTQVEYDEFGRLVGAHNTKTGAQSSFVFNELGRVLESVETNGLSTKYEYDTHNRLISHTDKRFNTTRYYRDDFGLVHFLVSPDTGVTQYDYDAAGNRLIKTNADGQVTRYTWDAANRLVEQHDIDGKTSYTYHETSGRLLETTNPSITERYTYTPFAQLKTHTRELDSHEFTTEYVYEPNGKIRNKILPDGQSLRFHYYDTGPDAGTLRAITREELFGLSQSMLLGEIDLDWRDGESSHLSHNGRRNEVQLYADGKVASMSVTDTLTLAYDYDDNGNIVGINQNGFDQSYEYSAGQLSGANTLTGDYNYEYDVTANRTSVSATNSSDNHKAALRYLATTKGNRFETWLDENANEQIDYRYNASGSPIAIGELKYEYNANQRPIKVMRNGAVVAEYSYNSFGERIKKVTYSQNQKKITYFLYDKRTLVAEIDGETLEHRQTVYLKHTPVAHLIGKSAYAVHTDNLGTPKLLTNDNGDTVWQAAHTPLGEAVIEKQDIQFNLRFPGQYADSETGTHYNYLRDYDPRTGRYLTSDPVGLEGGDNTYAYANNNVLGAMDVLGLSSQTLGLPGGLGNISNGAEPFSLDSVNAAVDNPNDLPPDVADLSVTNLDQLVTEFSTVGGGVCRTDNSQREFNRGVIHLSNGQYGGLIALDEINRLVDAPGPSLIDPQRPTTAASDAELAAALQNVDTRQNPWLIAIPACTDFEDVKARVTSALGKLVHDSEIQGIMNVLGEPGPLGCDNANAQIVDLTELHDEVLRRFQVKLATDQRVVDAEKELILAQQRHDDFMRIHGENPCSVSEAVCSEYQNLDIELYDAEMALGDILAEVYDELASDNMPPRLVADARTDARNRILIGVVGIFIPLTPADLAIEAGLIATSAWAGKIALMFSRFGDVLSVVRRGNRVDLATLVDEGAEAANRSNTIKMKRAGYSEFDSIGRMDYADTVRLENKVGTDNLSKLENDFANTPGLANAFNNDPILADGWKTLDDLGACSFEGNTTVVTELGSKPIRQLVVGLDRVLARNERTGAQGFKPVLAKYSNRYSEKVIIQSTNTSSGEKTSVVSNKIHPVFVQSKSRQRRVSSEGHTYQGEQNDGKWVDASELLVGDRLLNGDGTWSVVHSLVIVPEEFDAFNLTVKDFNTYFVGEQGKQSSFWVHNVCLQDLKRDPDALASIGLLTAKGGDGVRFSVTDGTVEITSKMDDGVIRKVGQYRDGNLIAFYQNSTTGKQNLEKLYEAQKNGTAQPIGLPEQGFQTYKVGDEFFVGRVLDNDIRGISQPDLDDLSALPGSHTVGRHGSGVTDEQLLTRAKTGIAPDGQKGAKPNMSSRFDSPQQMVQAKDDILASNSLNGSNIEMLEDGTRRVKINSTEVYGSGIPKDAQSIAEIEELAGVTAILKKDANGVWQIVTMYPGA